MNLSCSFRSIASSETQQQKHKSESATASRPTSCDVEKWNLFNWSPNRHRHFLCLSFLLYFVSIIKLFRFFSHEWIAPTLDIGSWCDVDNPTKELEQISSRREASGKRNNFPRMSDLSFLCLICLMRSSEDCCNPFGSSSLSFVAASTSREEGNSLSRECEGAKNQLSLFLMSIHKSERGLWRC